MVTWSDNGDGTMLFEMQVNEADNEEMAGDYWLAVGFSRDARMGEDTVCMAGSDFDPMTQLYWNPDGHDEQLYVGDDSGVESLSYESGTGFVYASFNRQVTLTFVAPTPDGPANEVNDLATESFFILAAAGVLSDGEPHKHDIRGYSAATIDFMA